MNIEAYYRSVHMRTNKMKTALYGLFLNLSSFTLIPIEVFFRKNMGMRYFSMFHVSMACLLLAIIPLMSGGLGAMFMGMFNRYGSYGYNEFHFNMDQLIFLIYLALVLIVAWKRANEIRTEPSVFDLEKFSLYSGEVHPFIRNFGGKKWDIRTIETKIEPLISFTAGLLILPLSHPLGIMLMSFSFINMLGQRAAYYFGDQHMLDEIDKIILNKSLKDTFIGDQEESNGVRTPWVRPRNPDMRKRILERKDNEEISFVS